MALEQYELKPIDIKYVTEDEVIGLVGGQLTNYTQETRVKKGYLQSGNFVTGSAGWQITANGDAEFNSGTFRGTLTAGSIDIPNTTSANSFHVDTSGNMWLGATTFAAAPAKISNAGAGTFSSIIITGGSINGSTVAAVQTRAEQLNKDFVFLGGQNDGLAASTSGTASITRRPITTYFALGANDGADLRATALGTKTDGNNLDWDQDYEFSIIAQTDVASGFTSVIFEITGTLNSNPGTQTQRHIGFYFDNGTVYASNADGTTETRTNISASVTKTNRTQYRFVYDAGVNILFYVNDTLVATHTTNLPSGTTTPPQFYLAASTGVAEALRLVLCNNYFLKIAL